MVTYAYSYSDCQLKDHWFILQLSTIINLEIKSRRLNSVPTLDWEEQLGVTEQTDNIVNWILVNNTNKGVKTLQKPFILHPNEKKSRSKDINKKSEEFRTKVSKSIAEPWEDHVWISKWGKIIHEAAKTIEGESES